MACNLKLSPTPDADFVGPVDATSTLTLKAPAGVAADIVVLTYAGKPISAPPFKFTIKAGFIRMVVLAEASLAGALLQLCEDCGGNTQVLDTFHFDPENPAVGYTVKGV
ncbi:MAG: hypothetical protein LAO20_11170 [Acidobacteriia bacterium]|nr:hypothetical protein [Terriglobia bacterium]